MTTQQKILDQYKELRGDFLDGDDQIKQDFFNDLVQYRYIKHIENYKNKKVLEIGCNKGYLLKTLQENGFNSLYGIDLSQSDLDIAQKRTSLNTLKKEDLFIELKENKFDVIISKDVMEHVIKEKQEEFVKSVYQALNEGGGGVAIIQVPNMDWLMSNHERYMDFTHEVGYTRESFGDVFRLYFKDVSVLPASYVFTNSLKRKIIFGFIRPLVLKVIRFILKIVGEGASDVWFEHREIMVVAKK